MDPSEATARDLTRDLAAAGVEAVASRAGPYWQVDAAPTGARTARVHCFWYAPVLGGRVLGMNPANARRQSRPTRAPPAGAEYLTVLAEGGVRIADGRTRSEVEAVAAVQAWLAGADLAALAGIAPFIDEQPRALRALAAQLGPERRWDIGDERGDELRIYGDGRSCRIVLAGDGFGCRFLVGPAQVARSAAPTDVAGVARAVAGWLDARVPVRALAAAVPGLEVERHAEVLEADPARWHWLHVHDRIADSDDILAPLRDVLEALARSPIASRFYTYSSMFWLCFSASSHYPWVDDELPIVTPRPDGLQDVTTRSRVLGTACGVADTVALVEEALASSPLQPFFGAGPG